MVNKLNIRLILINNLALILYYILSVIITNFVNMFVYVHFLLYINSIVNFIICPLTFVICYHKILSNKIMSFISYFNHIIVNLMFIYMIYTILTQFFSQRSHCEYLDLNLPLMYNFKSNMFVGIMGFQFIFPIGCIVKIISLLRKKSKSKSWRYILNSMFSSLGHFGDDIGLPSPKCTTNCTVANDAAVISQLSGAITPYEIYVDLYLWR